MYENAFNSIERQLRAEEGIANELDYRRMQTDLYAHSDEDRPINRPIISLKNFSHLNLNNKISQ